MQTCLRLMSTALVVVETVESFGRIVVLLSVQLLIGSEIWYIEAFGVIQICSHQARCHMLRITFVQTDALRSCILTDLYLERLDKLSQSRQFFRHERTYEI